MDDDSTSTRELEVTSPPEKKVKIDDALFTPSTNKKAKIDDEPFNLKSSITDVDAVDDDDDEEEEKLKVAATAVDESSEDDYSSDSDTMPEVVGDEKDGPGYSSEEMTEEKQRIYVKWSKKREGFAIPRFPKVSFFGMLVPRSIEDKNMLRFIRLAIEDHNKKMGEKLKLVRIIKCNCRLVGYAGYYVTLEAENEDTGRIATYEISVHANSLEEYEVPIFREKTKRRRGKKLLKS